MEACDTGHLSGKHAVLIQCLALEPGIEYFWTQFTKYGSNISLKEGHVSPDDTQGYIQLTGPHTNYTGNLRSKCNGTKSPHGTPGELFPCMCLA